MSAATCFIRCSEGIALAGARQNLDHPAENDRTWTAGMTKGKAPADLHAQLQQFRELKRVRR